MTTSLGASAGRAGVRLVSLAATPVARASAGELQHQPLRRHPDRRADAVRIRYVIDMAEIPTFQEMQDARPRRRARPPERGRAGSPRTAERARARAAPRGRRRAAGRSTSQRQRDRSSRPAPAGCRRSSSAPCTRRRSRAGRDAREATLRYRDENYAGRAGWKEVIVDGRARRRADRQHRAATDRSRELTDYPTDLLDSPPQDLRGAGDVLAAEPDVHIAAAPRAGAAPTATPRLCGRTPSRHRRVQPVRRAHADVVTRGQRRWSPPRCWWPRRSARSTRSSPATARPWWPRTSSARAAPRATRSSSA